jgi:SHS2 domain-containing protein
MDNVPGKFLSYMQYGLPVLATVNKGNDLAGMIREHRVGQVCESDDLRELVNLFERLLVQIDVDESLPVRCTNLFKSKFSVEAAATQIAVALSTYRHANF